MRAIASKEIGSSGSLLALQLQSEEFDRGILAATDKKTITFYLQLGWRQVSIERLCLPYLQILPAELCDLIVLYESSTSIPL